MARDITKLHPRLQVLANQLIEKAAEQGLLVRITSCVRDAAEQQDCVDRGTSSCRYPWSHHNWGTAFDICRNDGKGAYENRDGWFEAVGAIGERLGLEWGGSWKSPVDRPHFQLPDWGTGCGLLIKTYGTPEKFMATWASEETEAKLVVDGCWGTKTTRRLQEIFKTPADGVVSHQYVGWRRHNPGITGSFQWESDPAEGGSALIGAIQAKVGACQDGYIGPDTIKAMQAWMGTEQDGFFSEPSACIRALQEWCNQQ